MCGPQGLRPELVVPPERLERMGESVLREQFVRTPYAVSFQRKEATFILVTLHVLFGDAAEDRIPELQEIADWMSDWARRSNRFHHNLFTLGDFNIDDREGSPLFDAFTSTGLTVPEALQNLPRTVFDDPGDPSDDNFYDQIAWFETGNRGLIDLELRTGGNFDFLPHVYTNTNLSRTSISHRISDHYPPWVEFGIWPLRPPVSNRVIGVRERQSVSWGAKCGRGTLGLCVVTRSCHREFEESCGSRPHFAVAILQTDLDQGRLPGGFRQRVYDGNP